MLHRKRKRRKKRNHYRLLTSQRQWRSIRYSNCPVVWSHVTWLWRHVLLRCIDINRHTRSGQWLYIHSGLDLSIRTPRGWMRTINPDIDIWWLFIGECDTCRYVIVWLTARPARATLFFCQLGGKPLIRSSCRRIGTTAEATGTRAWCDWRVRTRVCTTCVCSSDQLKASVISACRREWNECSQSTVLTASTIARAGTDYTRLHRLVANNSNNKIINIEKL